MTQPVPADPALEAPTLVGTGIDAVVRNAGRLGLTWNLMLATVLSGTEAIGMKVVCDGDTTPLSATSMIDTGDLAQGTRVYLLVVPPSGLFIIGTL